MSQSSRTAGGAALSRFDNQQKSNQNKVKTSATSHSQGLISEARMEIERENFTLASSTVTPTQMNVAQKLAAPEISSHIAIKGGGSLRVLLDCPITGKHIPDINTLSNLSIHSY